MTRSVPCLRTSEQVRRYNVVALVLVLGAWLITAAMHLHGKDPDAGGVDTTHCSYCFALSTGVAPAPELRIPAVVVAPAIIVAFEGMAVEDQAALSFYLSRGPPAA